MSDTSFANGTYVPTSWLQDINNSTYRGVLQTFSVAGGTTNALLLTHIVPWTSVQDGQLLSFRAAYTNTGPCTVGVDSLSVVPLVSALGPLSASALLANGIYLAQYNSALQAWVLINTSATGGGTVTSVAVSGTSGLTGSGTITTSGSIELGLSASGVTSGTYAYPASITLDEYGRVTSATSGTSGGGTSTPLSDATPLVNGTASAGTSGAASRGDHVHPTDTSRLATSGGTISSYYESTASGSTSVSGTITLDMSAGNNVDWTLTGNTTVSTTNIPTSGTTKPITARVVQGSTAYTLTITGAKVQGNTVSGGAVPLPSAAGAETFIEIWPWNGAIKVAASGLGYV